MFVFFSFAAPKFGISFTWVDVHIGKFDFTQFFAAAVVALTLHLLLRLRGAALRASTPSRWGRPRRRAPSGCRSGP